MLLKKLTSPRWVVVLITDSLFLYSCPQKSLSSFWRCQIRREKNQGEKLLCWPTWNIQILSCIGSHLKVRLVNKVELEISVTLAVHTSYNSKISVSLFTNFSILLFLQFFLVVVFQNYHVHYKKRNCKYQIEIFLSLSNMIQFWLMLKWNGCVFLFLWSVSLLEQLCVYSNKLDAYVFLK